MASGVSSFVVRQDSAASRFTHFFVPVNPPSREAVRRGRQHALSGAKGAVGRAKELVALLEAFLGPRGDQSRNSPLNRRAESSVYLTVFEMLRCPRYAWIVRVSVPWLANW